MYYDIRPNLVVPGYTDVIRIERVGKSQRQRITVLGSRKTIAEARELAQEYRENFVFAVAPLLPENP